MTLSTLKIYKILLISIIIFVTIFAIVTKLVYNPTTYDRKEFDTQQKEKKVVKFNQESLEEEKRMNYNIKIKDKVW
ncbi:MAG: hypothetical protein U9N42_04170 [Campylobacterota bacterium]|nr:hypothetical protein [Campylobacterota bacterium]